MIKVKFSTKFQKDVKRLKKRRVDLSLLIKTVEMLQNDGTLPARYKAHQLAGEYSDCMECHIAPDWILIYKINYENNSLYLSRTGTHSDYLGKVF